MKLQESLQQLKIYILNHKSGRKVIQSILNLMNRIKYMYVHKSMQRN